MISVAQPGGFGGNGPGGRPPMGQRPATDRSTFNSRSDASSATTVKKKKRVTAGSTFKVVGALRDSVTGEFLPYVNVSLLDSVDSTFVKGAATNMDGYFELTEIPAGGYFLRVSAIGYQNIFRPVHVDNNTALGTLRVKPGATSLNEVVITAERPLYAMDGEKTIYNVSDDPSIQTGTTNDALQNAPGVEVDVEGNITLRGVSSVEIWINDKPSKLTEENLKTYLETLPANALDRIETITNPSAKYATDAEAVINIVTSVNVKSNHFVSIGMMGSTQPFIGPFVSYMWANERLSVNLFAGGRYNYKESSSSSRAVSRRDGTINQYDTTSVVSDTSENEAKRLNGSMGVHIDYAIDSMTDLSLHGNFNYNYSTNYSLGHQFYDQTYQLSNPFSYNRFDTNDNKNRARFGMFGASLTHKFDREGHNLRIFFDGSFNRGNVDNYVLRDYDLVFDDENKYYENNTGKQSYSLNARYNRPYSRQGEMSYGLGLNHNNAHNIYHRWLKPLGASDYSLIDTLRAYEYEGSDNRVNADVNWTHRWGNFTLELGLGGRMDNINFNYISQQEGFSDDTSYNFFTLTPSIHTSYRTEDMHNFKLNYAMRMSNPGESQLTLFKSYGDDSYSIGNRKLKAATTHSMEAGWTKFFDRFGSVGVEAYGRYSVNEISNLTEATSVEDEYLRRIVNYTTPYNMGSSYRMGGTLHMTYRPTGFINVRLYANIYDYGYRMERPNGQVFENSKLSYSLRLNVWAKLFSQYQFYVSGGYTSPTISLASESKERYSMNFGLRADFFKRKLSAFINVQDIFNWGKRIGTGSRNTNPYYLTDVTSKTVNSRSISAGITLRFGKMELEKKAQSASLEDGSDSE
ncbi:MAG: TonB-dependent receptor [Bacteroidales bacterium]|nr:TonB-dependent receptor [Bacteroidales bacterium]